MATPAQPTVYPDEFATAAANLFATAAAGPQARPTATPRPTPAPAPVGEALAPAPAAVVGSQTVAVPPVQLFGAASGLGVATGAYVTVALASGVAAKWAAARVGCLGAVVVWGLWALTFGLPVVLLALGGGAFAVLLALKTPLGLAALPPAAGVWAWRTGRVPHWLLDRLSWTWRLPWRREAWAEARRFRKGGFDWVVPDVVPCAIWEQGAWWPLRGARRLGFPAIVAGQPGTCKSYLMTLLAVCAVLGLPWLGRPVRRLRAVLYVDLELTEVIFWRRVKAIVAGLGLPPEELKTVRARIKYLSLKAYGETLYVPTRDERERGKRAAGQERIARTLRATGAGLLLVDSLTYGSGLSPGDQDGYQRLLLSLEGMGVPVLLIDHLNDKGDLAAAKNKERIARAYYRLEKTAGGVTRLVLVKPNFGGKVPPVPFSTAFVEDAEGELVSVAFTLSDGDTASPSPPAAGAGLRPRPAGPSGGPQTPDPKPQDSPIGGASGVGVGVGVHRGAADRATQGQGQGPRQRYQRQHQRKAYAPILAAVERRGPGADVSYDDLADELGYARSTVVNRCGELARLGRLASGPDGTVRLT
jgi:AAA domain